MARAEQEGSSIVFDRAADYYDRTRGYPPGVADQVAALVARAGRLTSRSRVLDVGVGTGRIALPLATRVGQVVGIDRSRAMLDRLRAKRAAEPVVPLVADATALPLLSGSFAAALAVHLFHLIPQWREALLEVKRVLAPGGCLLLGHDDQLLPELWGAAYAVVPKPEVVGVANRTLEFPVQAGFRWAGEVLEQPYLQRVSLPTMLQELEQRVWSSTWLTSDADHAGLVVAMRAAMFERFGSLDAVVDVERRFTVRVYVPD
jgi:ubiquinone/menaquinone biosynthesis C-methylase UbiE